MQDKRHQRYVPISENHLQVHVLVKLCSKVTRHLPTAVIIPVIFRDMIDIMKNHTVPLQIFHSLLEAHVKQHGSVKRLSTCLGKKKKTENKELKEKKDVCTLRTHCDI